MKLEPSRFEDVRDFLRDDQHRFTPLHFFINLDLYERHPEWTLWRVDELDGDIGVGVNPIHVIPASYLNETEGNQ